MKKLTIFLNIALIFGFTTVVFSLRGPENNRASNRDTHSKATLFFADQNGNLVVDQQGNTIPFAVHYNGEDSDQVLYSGSTVISLMNFNAPNFHINLGVILKARSQVTCTTRNINCEGRFATQAGLYHSWVDDDDQEEWEKGVDYNGRVGENVTEDNNDENDGLALAKVDTNNVKFDLSAVESCDAHSWIYGWEPFPLPGAVIASNDPPSPSNPNEGTVSGSCASGSCASGGGNIANAGDEPNGNNVQNIAQNVQNVNEPSHAARSYAPINREKNKPDVDLNLPITPALLDIVFESLAE